MARPLPSSPPLRYEGPPPPGLPGVMLAGQDSARLRIALLKLSHPTVELKLTARAFLQGSAHPQYYPASPFERNGRAFVLFDGTTHWTTSMYGSRYLGALPELLVAAAGAGILLLDLGGGPLEEPTRSLLRVLASLGLSRACLHLGSAPEADRAARTQSAREVLAGLAIGEPPFILSGDLALSARCRCGAEACPACAPWIEFQSQLAGLEASPRALPEDAAVLGAGVATGFGAAPGGLRVPRSPGAPSVEPGTSVELLTEHGPVSTRVIEVRSEALIFQVPGLPAARVLGVGRPGAARVVKSVDVRVLSAAAVPSARPELFSLRTSWGRCQVTPRGSRWHLESVRPFIVCPEQRLYIIHPAPNVADPVTVSVAQVPP